MAIGASTVTEDRTPVRAAGAVRSPVIDGDGQPEKLMAIGQVARRSGFTVKALRFYGRLGLLPPAARSPGGYRLYAEADLHRLDFIRQAKRLGLPLDAIRELVAGAREQPRGKARLNLLRILAERIAQTEEQIELLTRLRRELGRRRQALARQVPRLTNGRGYCTCLRDGASASDRGAVTPGIKWSEPASRVRRRR